MMEDRLESPKLVEANRNSDTGPYIRIRICHLAEVNRNSMGSAEDQEASSKEAYGQGRCQGKGQA